MRIYYPENNSTMKFQNLKTVRIVGGQSGQSFGHLVELKLRVDAVKIISNFCSKILWLFYIVRIKIRTRTKILFLSFSILYWPNK